MKQRDGTGPDLPLEKPSWLSEQPLIVAGNWDTAPIFRTRKGGNPLWHAEDYEREHGEEAVRKLKELGVTLAILHFYKGFGLAAEKEQLEDTMELASLCKKHGIRVGVYVGSTVAYETFLLEEPSATRWFVPDYLGGPVRYGGTQTFRKRVYFMHPGYIDYMKKVLRIAVEDVGADLIHFDNTSLRARRPAFFHPLAKQHFRDSLTRLLTAKQRKDRFGFEDLTHLDPPLYEVPVRTLDDPLFQEWTDFRCQQLADFYGEMGRFIRQMNPEVVVENNPSSGLSGINTMWEQGVDYPRLLAHTNIVWTEEGNEAGLRDDGTLVSKIRTYKQATGLNNQVFTYTADSPLQMGESLAFNRQCLGMIGGVLAGFELSEARENYDFDNPYTWGGEEPGFGLTEEKVSYIRFLHNNFQFYRNVQTVADVAVLRSYATMAYHNGRPHQSTYLVEQTLIQGKVPFQIIFDSHLSALSQYRVLVLADQQALSDLQLELIREFVRGGGGLVATEQTSLYTEWRRRRPDFGLKDLFGIAPPKWQARARRPEPVLKIDPVRRTVDSGRVVYLPEVVPEVERPWQEPMASQFWKLPRNWEQILSSIVWAAGGESTLEIDTNLTTVMELTRLEDSAGYALHLLNYAVETEPVVRDIKVRLRLSSGETVQSIEMLSPERVGSQDLPFSNNEGKILFNVPELRTYNLVIIHTS